MCDAFISFYLWWLAAGFHPFFVSMTEIGFDEKEKRTEVSVRIFTDDFEKELGHHCHCRVDFARQKDSAMQARQVEAYLRSAIRIEVNGAKKQLTLIGFEKEEESIWSYLEAPQIQPPVNVVVENRLLHTTQPKQINMVRLKTKATDQTRQLVHPHTLVEFRLP